MSEPLNEAVAPSPTSMGPSSGPHELARDGTAGPVEHGPAVALQALSQALTPQALGRLAGLLAELTVLADELARSRELWVQPLLEATAQAARQLHQQSRPVGWSELVRLAVQPETRRGLLFFLELARELGRRLEKPARAR